MNLLKSTLIFCIIIPALNLSAQQDAKSEFNDIITLPCTPVKSQGSTGTCWSFATTSFLESELLRMGKGEVDLSEMFFVANAYKNKAVQYFLYQGNNNFGQGGQAHDVLDVIRQYGMVPDSVFPGIKKDGRFQHRELGSELDEIVKKSNKGGKNFDAADTKNLDPVLEKYLGDLPGKFEYGGATYTPSSFYECLGINLDDYIEISSYSHHPFYKPFILEIPDNWSHELYCNLPIDELVDVMKYSLSNGYTVCWDGDMSERTFSHKKAKADLPDGEIGKVNQELRLETFYNRKTTDDHLMHIIGMAKDEDGRIFFNTKNSWGADSNENGGFLYISEDYIRLKTIAILIHRNSIPPEVAKKLGI